MSGYIYTQMAEQFYGQNLDLSRWYRVCWYHFTCGETWVLFNLFSLSVPTKELPIMDDIIVFQLLKTKRRLTFDILYQREDTRYRGEDDGEYFTFRASNGHEVISRSRMDVQTERLWLLGASDDERSGSMVFSSDAKRDKAHENCIQALTEWVQFIRTGGWNTRPTPELTVPLIPEAAGIPDPEIAEKGWHALVDKSPEYKDTMLHSEGFATEADAAMLLGLDESTLRARITQRALFALPEPNEGAFRIPVWALHLDLLGMPTLNLHQFGADGNQWEIHAFMSTPNEKLHGLRPFECLVSIEHLPLKMRAMREALAARLNLAVQTDPLVDLVGHVLRDEVGEWHEPNVVLDEIGAVGVSGI